MNDVHLAIADHIRSKLSHFYVLSHEHYQHIAPNEMSKYHIRHFGDGGTLCQTIRFHDAEITLLNEEIALNLNDPDSLDHLDEALKLYYR